MKSFRTTLTYPRSPLQFDYSSRLISLGSCFSANIGRRFFDRKFNICLNPFGQQYNPSSIANSIQRLLEKRIYKEEELIFQDGLFHSMDHHSDFSAPTAIQTLRLINERFEAAANQLFHADVMFITLATAHVFRFKETARIVNNCHKIPSARFDKLMLDENQILSEWKDVLIQLRTANPQLRILFSISPIRYLSDGFFENSRSKACLFSVLSRILEEFDHCFYFPAFEIMMDDLRDYRFYANDLIHPNELAISYIWDSLTTAHFNSNTLDTMRKVEAVINNLNHIPRQPQLDAYRNLLINCRQTMLNLRNLDFTNELIQVNQKLAELDSGR